MEPSSNPNPNGASRSKRTPGFNYRRLTAPLAAFTMAVLLYTYSVTAIRAAKLNAARHREADGGQLNMHNEQLRMRGLLERPLKDKELFVEAATRSVGKGGFGTGEGVGRERSEGEEELMKAAKKRVSAGER